VNDLFVANAGPHTSLAGAQTNAICVVSGLKASKENPLVKYLLENANGVAPADWSQPAPTKEKSEPK
jgi:hypothetical protein